MTTSSGVFEPLCNICLSDIDGKMQGHLLSCGHMICHGCWSGGTESCFCPHCGTRAQAAALENPPVDVQAYLQNPLAQLRSVNETVMFQLHHFHSAAQQARKALHELRLVHLREVERRKRAEQEVSDLRRRQASSSSTSRRPDSWQDASSPSGSDIDCKSRSETFDTRTSEQGFNSRDELLGKSGSSLCMSHDEDVRTPVGGRDKSGHVERFAGVGRLMTPNANASRRLEDPRTRDTWADGTRGDSAGSSSSAKKVNRCQLEGGNKGIPSPNISGLRDQANTLVGGENRDGSYGVHHSAFAVASRPGQSVIGVAQARRPGTRGPLPGQPAGHGSTPPKLNGNGNVDQSRGQQTSHLGSQRIGTPGRPARPSWHVDRECRVDSGRGTALWPRARKMKGSTNSRDRQTATPTRSTENKEQPQPPHGRSQVRTPLGGIRRPLPPDQGVYGDQRGCSDVDEGCVSQSSPRRAVAASRQESPSTLPRLGHANSTPPSPLLRARMVPKRPVSTGPRGLKRPSSRPRLEYGPQQDQHAGPSAESIPGRTCSASPRIRSPQVPYMAPSTVRPGSAHRSWGNGASSRSPSVSGPRRQERPNTPLGLEARELFPSPHLSESSMKPLSRSQNSGRR